MAEAKATQDFVQVKEIRDGIVVLKDGTMLMIFMCSSLNFALKSADEQQAIILQYQNFLNSLDFTFQIVVQSRRLDIRPYLASLSERMGSQPNELLKIQLKEYINFIRSFTEGVSIMEKSFYAVVPYQPPIFQTSSQSGVASKVFGIFGGKKDTREQKEQELLTFEENRTQLEQRSSVVTQGLMRCGVRSVALGTEELIELFYKIFNPEESGGVPKF
ncbi:MAG TPA: hypothetical protein P5056_04230 [Candidatus Paceibacterota bacterium]|nr:hypothetical protein [Candidatus Paceibacterota bacterium]